jgi:hypothetical protein
MMEAAIASYEKMEKMAAAENLVSVSKAGKMLSTAGEEIAKKSALDSKNPENGAGESLFGSSLPAILAFALKASCFLCFAVLSRFV